MELELRETEDNKIDLVVKEPTMLDRLILLTVVAYRSTITDSNTALIEDTYSITTDKDIIVLEGSINSFKYGIMTHKEALVGCKETLRTSKEVGSIMHGVDIERQLRILTILETFINEKWTPALAEKIRKGPRRILISGHGKPFKDILKQAGDN